MPQTDFLPRPDGAFIAFAERFSERIGGDPAHWNVPAEMATQLVTETADLRSAYDAAVTPATRTPLNVRRKDLARRAVTKTIRRAAGLIKCAAHLSRADKESLGLKLRPKTLPRWGAPRSRPWLAVAEVQAGSVVLRSRDAEAPGRKRKPAGVAAQELFVTARGPGDRPPNPDPRHWRYAGGFTTDLFRIDHAPSDRGKQLYFAARWRNRSGKPGPWSNVVAATAA